MQKHLTVLQRQFHLVLLIPTVVTLWPPIFGSPLQHLCDTISFGAKLLKGPFQLDTVCAVAEQDLGTFRLSSHYSFHNYPSFRTCMVFFNATTELSRQQGEVQAF